MCLFDAGHYATEVPAMKKLRERLPVKSIFIEASLIAAGLQAVTHVVQPMQKLLARTSATLLPFFSTIL